MKRYEGRFLSRQGVLWTVEIDDSRWTSDEPEGELTFDAEEACVIDWPSRSKHEAMEGSSMTLALISPGDRTYTDLYTTDPLGVHVTVSREGEAYWRGVLDAEMYEEPYEKLNGYDVRLTFTDLGVLERIKYDLSGVRSIREVIERATVTLAGVAENGTDTSMVSLRHEGAETPTDLSDIYVDSANWEDEEGEKNTYYEAIEAMLQPLGLKLTQRNGRMHVYDLNSVAACPEKAQAAWSGDRQTLSVDSVYSRCTVRFSPYVKAGALNDTKPMGEDRISADRINRNSHTQQMYGGSMYWSWPAASDKDVWVNQANNGFTAYFATQTQLKGITLHGGARFVRIVPQISGDERQGIALSWSTWVGTHNDSAALANNVAIDQISARYSGVSTNMDVPTVHRLSDAIGGPVGITPLVELPPISLLPVDSGHYIRLAMDVLVGYAPNPLNQEVDLPVSPYDSEGTWDYKKGRYKSYGHILKIPVLVLFEADDGTWYYWKADNPLPRLSSIWQTVGQWRAWDGLVYPAQTHLTVYESSMLDDTSKAYEGSVIGKGWSPVRQNVIEFKNTTGANLFKQNDAQYIPVPSFAGPGKLRVRIMDQGWRFRRRDSDDDLGENDPFYINYGTSWLLISVPEVSVTPRGYEDADTDDVVYEGKLNAQAKDELEISTKCGTVEGGRAMARGAYLKEDKTQVQRMSRGGRTAHPEDLLIGTLYSQHAERHTRLEGEIELHPTAVLPYSERNQPGLAFWRGASRQNCILGTDDVVIVEVSEDTFAAGSASASGEYSLITKAVEAEKRSEGRKRGRK